jgi:hypothetical protein
MATKKAVQAFQKKYGIPATGFVGPMTIAKLRTFVISPIVPPTAIEMNVDTTSATKAVVSFGYNGGGEAPQIWFMYGSSKDTMSVKSEIFTGKTDAGTVGITIDNLGAGADCYVRAYIKNSEGMTSSEIKRCVK